MDDKLFVIGGQEGDFMAKPGSPIFKCSRRLEVYFCYFMNVVYVCPYLLHLGGSQGGVQ